LRERNRNANSPAPINIIGWIVTVVTVVGAVARFFTGAFTTALTTGFAGAAFTAAWIAAGAGFFGIADAFTTVAISHYLA
jgi:hypothetical protein